MTINVLKIWLNFCKNRNVATFEKYFIHTSKSYKGHKMDKIRDFWYLLFLFIDSIISFYFSIKSKDYFDSVMQI